MIIVVVVLVAGLLLARLLGVAGVESLDSWAAATRAGLAVMLVFTGIAHFTKLRYAMVKMMPPAIAHPMGVVTFTGVCEIAGAIGLLVPVTRLAAAISLIVFFLAVLPANVHAARAGIRLGGKPATPLALRVPVQIAFIALTAWAGIVGR